MLFALVKGNTFDCFSFCFVFSLHIQARCSCMTVAPTRWFPCIWWCMASSSSSLSSLDCCKHAQTKTRKKTAKRRKHPTKNVSNWYQPSSTSFWLHGFSMVSIGTVVSLPLLSVLRETLIKIGVQSSLAKEDDPLCSSIRYREEHRGSSPLLAKTSESIQKAERERERE